ncbi:MULTISPECIES: hypothetical protein [Treponema]|uniref:hypothetical protein n=1 Tax=Treponema TaxID=157 RepID=UPI0002B55288|nr:MULTISPECIES: hypothetical protein [Treponema]EMB47479.1 hypothetical protein HMPREF9729_00639 [Treponema denticola ASLM]EMD55517.1 hypothetical protein HMPREF9728_02412 [Treponema denticola US-Trep]UTD09176.1 hypothetical protein HYB91_01115 [Treponema sp. B152]
MKKNVILLFAAALLTAVLILQTSCNLTAPEYGIVTLDFENGAARSIGANGLPNLSDSTMQIDITGNSIVPITKQLEKDEPKVFSQFLPVGETIHIKVSIITPSATWTGFTDLTVESGDNEAAVKLNKVIASMRPIPFSVNGSSAPYTFKLNMGGTPLEIAQSGSGRDYLFFTRDGKGRLYVAYSDPPVVIRRYTSEGDHEKKLSLPGSVTSVDSFTTDLKTGRVYMSSGSTLYEIDNNGNLMPVIGSASTIKASAAYNGYLFVYSSLPAGGQLQMYRLTGTPPALVGTLPQDPLKDIIPITDDPAISHESGECQDMFAYGNKVYLVFTISAPYDYDGSKAFYGGVLECTYTEDGHITESGRYGFGGMESYKRYPGPYETRIYRFNGDAPYERFYGARRIIGFEDGVLYIADDGAIFSSIEGVQGYNVYPNINRIAKLDTRSGTLTFENTDAKWYREWR